MGKKKLNLIQIQNKIELLKKEEAELKNLYAKKIGEKFLKFLVKDMQGFDLSSFVADCNKHIGVAIKGNAYAKIKE